MLSGSHVLLINFSKACLSRTQSTLLYVFLQGPQVPSFAHIIAQPSPQHRLDCCERRPWHQADFRGWTVYARTTLATTRRNLLGFWRRLRWPLGALRLRFEPLPQQRVCSRPLPAPPAQLVRPLVLGPLVWSLVRLHPLFAVALPWFAGARLAHRRGCPGPLLPTPLRFGRPLSPV